MEINEAIRSIIDGEAILFTGAGFSVGAEKSNGEQLCTAKTLAHKLLEECGFDKKDFIDDLGQAADIYKEMKGTFGLMELLRSEFLAESLSPEQMFIAQLPWFRIYTTNYDNVLEKAFQDAGKQLKIAVLSDRQTDYRDKKTLCVCLNGSLSRLSEDKLTEEIKLTNSSYLTDSFRSSPWLSFFQTDLKTAKAVFFVGYSMQYDIDIQRIVFSNNELQNKTFFILREEEPKGNVLLVKRFGQPFPIGLTKFVDLVKDVQKNYVAVKSISRPLLCFDKVEVNKTIPTIKDRDAFELYLKGDIGNYDKVYYSLISSDNLPFCVYRTRLDEILNAVTEGERNFVVHSSLGNGKTLFLISLATLFSRNGFKVYYFQRYRSTIAREIEDICNESGSVVIMFDKYSDCMPYFDIIKAFRKEQVLVVADRSALNDINYDKITNLLGEFSNIDLNKLDDNEITQLSKLLTRYGLWGDNSHLREKEKFDFIESDCHRSMAKAILQILHSPNILNKYKYLTDDVRNKKGFYDALIYILIAQVAGFSVDTDDLVNIFDASQLNSPSFRKNASVREFIDFDGNRVKGTSSLFARVLLEEIFDSGIIVDVMLAIFKRLNEQRIRPEVRRVLQKMVNFSNLQHILSKKDKAYKANLIHYYDSIHTLSFCAENPYFWLQYAILKLSEYDYETAEVYFKTAYSYTKKHREFDTYQIDNHYARFLLENEVVYGSQQTCMKAFNAAHEVLMNPKHKVDSYYYPYRVAQNYYPFYEKYYAGMNETEKQTFLVACENMQKRIQWYLHSTSTKEGRGDVQKAKDLMKMILEGK